MAKLPIINETHDILARDDTDVGPLFFESIPEREKGGAEGKGLRDPSIVDFNGSNNPENPLNWPSTRKITSIVVVSLTALLSPIGSTISAAAAANIMLDFGTTDKALGTFITTIYLLGYAFGPIVIAPLSELYGRAIMFRFCALLFFIFNIACAVANSLGSLAVYRLLTGIAGSGPSTLGASSIGDMVVREKRGVAMSVYVMGPVFGPTMGPVIGGYLTPVAG